MRSFDFKLGRFLKYRQILLSAYIYIPVYNFASSDFSYKLIKILNCKLT